MGRATLLLVTLALGPLASASTQEPPDPGQRVKVRYSCTTISWKDCSSEGIVGSSPDLCVEVEDAPRHLRYAACSTSGFSSNDTST